VKERWRIAARVSICLLYIQPRALYQPGEGVSVHSAARNGAVSGIVTIITARENDSRLAPMPLHTYPVWQPREARRGSSAN
jgi:hypothetical protein